MSGRCAPIGPHARQPAGADGFTLLELLVVLAVLGGLVVGLAQGLHFGVQLWNQQRRSLDGVSELDAADRALRGLIEQMDPGGRIETADIDGTAETLRFTSRLPEAAGAAQTRRAEVMLLVDPLHRLVLRSNSELARRTAGFRASGRNGAAERGRSRRVQLQIGLADGRVAGGLAE